MEVVKCSFSGVDKGVILNSHDVDVDIPMSALNGSEMIMSAKLCMEAGHLLYVKVKYITATGDVEEYNCSVNSFNVEFNAPHNGWVGGHGSTKVEQDELPKMLFERLEDKL